ncbi:predicted protein [Chaetomium globosum CBS 148.51]|uniref:Uncharacterized protein n=1 Tax=Chaetomium globosum (strain ATCC 6205 / CBS 148.51 / DSM 1962 / NBRC 6347 / NRRL 1970) TaxID=306901 RepID=Q2HHD6_CHAGB|nr:uncharacterized protein CHGG_00368 [Chaetomium globosum CBS 148.51]EAQ92133.1 predicted protein [Chaetomium globosum CBS 148.51]
MESPSTSSTKCKCLPPDFTPLGKGCKQPDECLGPGGAGIGDYCESCFHTARDSAVEREGSATNARATGLFMIAERAKDRSPVTSASSNPASASTSRHTERGDRLHSNPVASYRQRPLAPHEQPSQPHSDPITFYRHSAPPSSDHAGQADEPHGGPSTSHHQPAHLPTTNHTSPAAQLSGAPTTAYQQPPAVPPTTDDAAPQKQQLPYPELQPKPQPDTPLPPLTAREEPPQTTYDNTTNNTTNNDTTNDNSPPSLFFPAPSDGVGVGVDSVLSDHHPCVCQGTWTCRAGGLCEETIMFVEGDLCSLCEIFECGRWDEPGM